MSMTTSIAEKLTRSIVSGLIVTGDEFDPGFPTPDFNNVYQGQNGEFVTTIAYDSDGGSFNGIFSLYVISHDQSVRGIIGHTDDFQAAATLQDWQVRIHTDDRLRFSVRDGDSGGTLTHVFMDCPTGQWLNVGYQYNEDTGIMSLCVDLDVEELSVPNRIPADTPVPYLILGAPTRAYAVNCQFSDARLNQVLAFTQPIFNGVDQYATFADWTPDSANWTVTYQTDNEDGFIGLESPVFPLSEFGRVGANYHSGSLRKVELKSGHPMQGIRPMPGDGADRYATMPDFTLAGDLEIEFWFQRGDNLSGNISRILYGLSGSLSHITINNTDHPAPNNLTVVFINGGTLGWTGALNNIALGQKTVIKIVRAGTSVNLFVDGVDLGVRQVSADGYLFVQRIGTPNQASSGIISYLKITDLDTGETRIYNNTNDISSQLMDSGPDAQHGTWINGDDSDRVVLPITDRIYKMDEGSGDTFTDSSGGGNHATMQAGTTWEQGSELHTDWPCAEGAGTVMKDYIAQDIDGDTNGTLSSTALHNTRINP